MECNVNNINVKFNVKYIGIKINSCISLLFAGIYGIFKAFRNYGSGKGRKKERYERRFNT